MTSFDDPVVSIGSSQREWAAELTRFVSDYGGARLRGTVLTVDDALEQRFEILIVDDIASYMSPRFVERVQRLRRKIIGIYDPDLGEASKDRLLAMGVDAVVDAAASPEELLRVIAGLRVTQDASLARERPAVAAPVVDPYAPRRGLTAVVGDDHATDVALALAASMISLKQSVVVVDVDTVAPSLAQRLGLELTPNLLTALDAHTQLRGAPDDSVRMMPHGFGLLAGLPDAGEWHTVPPGDIVDLVEHLENRFANVVAKIHSGIEDLAPLAGRAGRFDVSRGLLGIAGQIVFATSPTPLALTRLLTWVAHVQHVGKAPIHVVFHDAPKSMYQRGEMSGELVRSFVPASITWLPSDARVARAIWNGEMVPAGKYLRAVRALARRLVDRSRVIGAPA